MTNLEVFGMIVILLIIKGGGVILYLALAGTAIIYALGANESPKGRRIFFGVLGLAMNRFYRRFRLFPQIWVAVMKLREFLTVFSNPDRIRIVKDDKAVYTGYLALIQHAENLEELMDAEVKRFSATPEIRHKEWKKRGLMAPLQPWETPEYSFADLQMSLYNTIYL